jgi:hypothetical protein
MPKRSFNSTIDRMINRLVNRCPQGNLGYAIGVLNTIIFGLYLFWPSYNMY